MSALTALVLGGLVGFVIWRSIDAETGRNLKFFAKLILVLLGCGFLFGLLLGPKH